MFISVRMMFTMLLTRTVFPKKVPSNLHARLRGRCRIASCRRTAPAGSETMPRLNPIMPRSSFSETQQAMPSLFGQKLKLLREEVGPHLAHTVAFFSPPAVRAASPDIVRRPVAAYSVLMIGTPE